MLRRSVAALNAANETTTTAFLDPGSGFLDIAAAVVDPLERMSDRGDLKADGDNAVAMTPEIDRKGRRIAAQVVAHLDTP